MDKLTIQQSPFHVIVGWVIGKSISLGLENLSLLDPPVGRIASEIEPGCVSDPLSAIP